ncbi:MAG: M20 aminoacylase family protein [Pseudomonadota bacterium]
MPIVNRIAAFAEDMMAWRRHLHAHPELGFACHETARFVDTKLRAFGVDEIHNGIAETGIVALIEGSAPGPTIGLRADMDALPIEEATGAPHASTVPGKMHACGHDGHTTMLLGAARYLAETRRFAGRVALIFQPAEEEGGGGGVMVDEGILERFDISQVYALHTSPSLPEGRFDTTPGAITACADTFHIHVEGRGGHAASPHTTLDPIPAALAIAQAMPTIVSRNRHPLDDLVISVTQFHAGSAENIVPDTAYINGTVRAYSEDVRDLVERRMEEIVAGTAAAFGVRAQLDYVRDYPPTINTAENAAFAVDVAQDVTGDVEPNGRRSMGAEDFSYLLKKCPGAYLRLGQGPGPGLHNAAFDFNDRIAPIGASFFARLVERAQPLPPA